MHQAFVSVVCGQEQCPAGGERNECDGQSARRAKSVSQRKSPAPISRKLEPFRCKEWCAARRGDARILNRAQSGHARSTYDRDGHGEKRKIEREQEFLRYKRRRT